MIAYFDTSALVPLVVDEPGSARAATLWGVAHRLVSVQLVYPEARAALARAQRSGRFAAHRLRDLVEVFEALYARLDLIDVDEELARRAGDLAEAHGLTGCDAVHLAAADRLRDPALVVVAGDERLLGAATAEGMTIASVA